MVIPFEILPVISSHVTIPENESPVMFEIPPIYTLDRITAYSFPPTTTMPLLPLGDPKMRSSFIRVRKRSSVSEALQAAISAAATKETMQANSHPWTENAFDFPKYERVYSEPPMTIKLLREVTISNHEPKSDW